MDPISLQDQLVALQKEQQVMIAKIASLESLIKAHCVQATVGASLGEEHRTIFQRYGHHLNRGVDGLLGLWRHLGGEHGWANYCLSPQQLSVLLSQDQTPVVHLRVNSTINEDTHGTYISEADVRPFFCQILSRLPNLKRIMITASPVSPFDWSSMVNVSNPFPSLRFLMLWSTPVRTEDLIALVKHVPSIIGAEDDSKGGVRINREYLLDPENELAMDSVSKKILVY